MLPFAIAYFRRMRSVFLACIVVAVCLTSAAVGAVEDDWIYVMRPGDTLIGIAAQNFANPDDWPIVQARNHIADPYRIPAGTSLRIPFRLLRPDPIAAEVLLVNGEVLHGKADAVASMPLIAGDVLRAGDSVRVSAGGNLSLRFADGSRLLVLEKTRFVLRRAARLGDSGRHQIEIELSEGNIESDVVAEPTGVRPQYEIRTPALRMSVRGTRFRAVADAGGATRGEVLAGRVRLSGARKSLLLASGFGSIAEPGRAPQPARQLLPAPQMINPEGRVERLPLRFAWSPVANAPLYRVQLLDEAMNLLSDGMSAETIVRWSAQPDGRYTLRVRAVGIDRLEGLDAEHGFVLDTQPEPPFARSPIGIAYGDSAHFDWTAGAPDSRYHFQLAADSAFKQLLRDEPALANPAINCPLHAGTYYWRVATVDARGDHGPFGDTISLDLKQVPSSPTIDSTEIGEERLHFRWRGGGRGETYLLQIASTEDFSTPLLERTTREPFIDVPRPDAGDYYLRVRAIEADGFSGPFGATQRFAVDGSQAWWLLLLLVPFAL